jgi:hypothetical protein
MILQHRGYMQEYTAIPESPACTFRLLSRNTFPAENGEVKRFARSQNRPVLGGVAVACTEKHSCHRRSAGKHDIGQCQNMPQNHVAAVAFAKLANGAHALGQGECSIPGNKTIAAVKKNISGTENSVICMEGIEIFPFSRAVRYLDGFFSFQNPCCRRCA